MAWDIAHDSGRQRAYDTAVERGLHGYTVPVRRPGKEAGPRHVVNNRLLFAACYGMPMRLPLFPWEK